MTFLRKFWRKNLTKKSRIFFISAILTTVSVLIYTYCKIECKNFLRAFGIELYSFKCLAQIQTMTVVTNEWKRQKDARNRTYILMWRRPWGLKTEGPREGFDVKGNCVITYDRSKIKDAEAVVFHYTALDYECMPWRSYRDTDQYFVFFNEESPAYMLAGEYRQNFRNFDGNFINLTMTYRSDSHISSTYQLTGKLVDIIQRGEGKKWVETILAKKTRMALWLVSDCDLTYGAVQRYKYAEEMFQAGLLVERYGRCFNNKEAFKNLPKETLQSYKFYLAFENGFHCKDYVTEKFWNNALSEGRVPVVWGPSKKDLTRIAPTKSFIHVDDFDSPANLVSYLQYLNHNDTAYREYFGWIEKPDKKTFRIVRSHHKNWALKLCDFLHRSKKTYMIVSSITDYYRNETKECLHPKRNQWFLNTFEKD